MLGLSPLGIFHTATGLVALTAGFWSLARDREISPRTGLGQTYVACTFLSAATALGIFHHGGFGPAHVLAILTIAALLLGTVCAFTTVFGRASRSLQAISYSATVLFHVIPGVTEVLIRFPRGAPLLRLSDASAFKTIYGFLVLVFLALLALQLKWLRGQPAEGWPPA
jgi:uncharacterized membrane protein